jgi:hypothetical protein
MGAKGARSRVANVQDCLVSVFVPVPKGRLQVSPGGHRRVALVDDVSGANVAQPWGHEDRPHLNPERVILLVRVAPVGAI